MNNFKKSQKIKKHITGKKKIKKNSKDEKSGTIESFSTPHAKMRTLINFDRTNKKKKER